MNKITVERCIKKVGTSLVIRATNELRTLNLDEGDLVKITFEKV